MKRGIVGVLAVVILAIAGGWGALHYIFSHPPTNPLSAMIKAEFSPAWYKGDTVIDNPTDREIHITVDGVAYTIMPYSSETVTLKTGEHRIGKPDGTEEAFTVRPEDYNSILNPTNTGYVTWSVVYLREGYSGPGPELIERIAVVNGKEYNGPIKTLNQTYIGHRLATDPYYFGLDEPFNEAVDPSAYLGGESATSVILTKIYRPKEFEEAYNELREEYMD